MRENYNVQLCSSPDGTKNYFPLYYSTRIFVQLWDYDTTLGKQLAKPIYQIWKTKGEDILLQNEKKKKKEKRKRINNNLISTLLNNNCNNCLRCQEYIGSWLKEKICISNLLTLVLSHCLLYVRGLWVMTTKYHFNTEPRKRNIMNIFVNNKTKSRTQSNNLHNSLN